MNWFVKSVCYASLSTILLGNSSRSNWRSNRVVAVSCVQVAPSSLPVSKKNAKNETLSQTLALRPVGGWHPPLSNADHLLFNMLRSITDHELRFVEVDN